MGAKNLRRTSWPWVNSRDRMSSFFGKYGRVSSINSSMNLAEPEESGKIWDALQSGLYSRTANSRTANSSQPNSEQRFQAAKLKKIAAWAGETIIGAGRKCVRAHLRSIAPLDLAYAIFDPANFPLSMYKFNHG